MATTVGNVVLVHGAFVDGSGWRDVYTALVAAGVRVVNVQIPTTSLADDVRATRRALSSLDGPAILVGHSYGGVVITEAGTHPNVAGLVYVAAFVPDSGESVATMAAHAPEGSGPPLLPPQDGALLIDRARFVMAFAADLPDDTAAFMADSQASWGLDAYTGAVTEPAWREKRSWAVIPTDDRMIPPDAQRAMASRAGARVVDVKGSHAVYVSQPQAVADVILRAAGKAP